jgi:hypothetical protein
MSTTTKQQTGRRSKAASARTLVRAGLAAQSALAKRAEALLALIERRKARIVEDFYDIGEALKELMDRKLYAALGFPSFEAMLAERGVIGREQARKLVAVVRQVPREQALALGQEKAYALVAYAAATPAPDTVMSLVGSGAKIAGQPVTGASVRDIEVATREAREVERVQRPLTAEEKAARKAQREAVSAVRGALRGLGITQCTVEATRDEVRVAIPMKQVGKLA